MERFGLILFLSIRNGFNRSLTTPSSTEESRERFLEEWRFSDNCRFGETEAILGVVDMLG